MKAHILSMIICLLSTGLFAQAPYGISYQAVARNAAGNPITNQSIRIRIKIHDFTAAGTILYTETHMVTTNSLGLFSINIGQGSLETGSFLGINWGNGSKFVQVEMDTTGGTSYSDMGTQQLMSVPYALYANTIPLSIQSFAGFISTINGNSSQYVFTGPTITITLTTNKRITGAATALLGLTSGSSAQNIDYGLCYSLAGQVNNFTSSLYTTGTITTTRSNFSGTYTVLLPAGTYSIGFGVRNGGPASISNNDYVNGWIMITDP